MSREMLNERTWTSSEVSTAFRPAQRTMSYGGVAVKAVFFLAVTAALAAIGWANASVVAGQGSGLVYLVGFIVLIGLTVAAVQNPRLALAAGLLYAVLNGLWIGAISRFYEEVFEGIVGLALLGTLAVCLGVLLLFSVAGFRVTPRGAQIIAVLVLGVSLLYLTGWLLSLFGVNLTFLYGYSPTAIVVSLVILGIAASTLLVDLTYVEQGVKAGVPKAAEWYAAFGIVSSIVWIYLEVLRLLARVAAARNG
ncbi:Bax inhibitor-1/YccA family protein [Actinotalea sp. M2MS4P-6]|uniref:Bax inhibitor-1/YccA family protein n=1 Tax=Actinotalea sp. M2MS4P-6 TaxID=2983762 RepID=UPI0021E3D6FF|nr:Bax inhibitor-1/YccA family protein [Actinotalea sp. M2MS4P-6]MCV2394402.1 Bax inhibitor-1/YccA family protein [Actinotalea sp. M2MS4P-6]